MIVDRDGYRIAYDELADTLYVSEGQPQPATDTHLDENHVLLRFVNTHIQAITITDFMERHRDGSWTDRLILDYLPAFPADAVHPKRLGCQMFPRRQASELDRHDQGTN